MKLGRRPDERRQFYRERFALTEQRAKNLSQWCMDALDACADDCARRLLLGVSEKQEEAA